MVPKKENIKDLELVSVGNIPSSEVNEQVEFVDELQQYYILRPIVEADDQNTRPLDMAWFESSKRAVIVHGRDVYWTYADDPEDAADRWLSNELDEEADPRMLKRLQPPR